MRSSGAIPGGGGAVEEGRNPHLEVERQGDCFGVVR